ncbi:cupin domain-containing protein [Pseudoalteromonas sp.]|uniref:JmjC domain-containing protein n=1 Tax=Pseudoalteromonas sp. TaxID=53249 RepID=UPI001BD09294|nr:cupin domain-containing protein [Pseudoalteromonas sp.]
MKFKEFLFQEDTREFFQGYWGKEYLHIANIPSALTINAPSNLLAKILELPRLKYPQVRVLSEGGALSPLLYTKSSEHGLDETIDPKKVARLACKPNTIKVENLASLLPEFALWDSLLATLFSSRITLNGYFSFGPSNGIPIHFDPHHIFAVQLYGQKEWFLGKEQSQLYPHKAVTILNDTAEVSSRRLILNENEILYLPPGRTHSVKTEKHSIHIAIGVHTPRCFHSISDLVDRTVTRHPELRADQPFSITEVGLTFSELRKSDIKIICDLLLASVNDD